MMTPLVYCIVSGHAGGRLLCSLSLTDPSFSVQLASGKMSTYQMYVSTGILYFPAQHAT